MIGKGKEGIIGEIKSAFARHLKRSQKNFNPVKQWKVEVDTKGKGRYMLTLEMERNCYKFCWRKGGLSRTISWVISLWYLEEGIS